MPGIKSILKTYGLVNPILDKFFLSDPKQINTYVPGDCIFLLKTCKFIDMYLFVYKKENKKEKSTLRVHFRMILNSRF